MDSRKWVSIFFLSFGLVAFGQVHGECAKCKMMAAWGLAAQPAGLFNSNEIGRYEGQVLSVQEVAPASGVEEGIYVLLKTDDGNMAVRLGPAWYLQKQGFAVQPYEKLEIMASKVKTGSDHPALVATKAKKGDKTIALRNVDGETVWKKVK